MFSFIKMLFCKRLRMSLFYSDQSRDGQTFIFKYHIQKLILTQEFQDIFKYYAVIKTD